MKKVDFSVCSVPSAMDRRKRSSENSSANIGGFIAQLQAGNSKSPAKKGRLLPES
jgi:hypothetical protein